MLPSRITPRPRVRLAAVLGWGGRWASGWALALAGALTGCATVPTSPAPSETVRPEPKPSAADAPMLTPREAQAGATYAVHIDHLRASGSHVLVDAIVTVVSPTRLDVELKQLLAGSKGPFFVGQRFQLLLLSPGFWEATADLKVFLFEAPKLAEILQGTLNPFELQWCITPRRPHRAGETWSEPSNGGTLHWDVGPTEVVTGATWVRYRVQLQYTTVVYDTTLRVRADEGFMGECTIESHLIPKEPTTTKITSTRLR